MSNESGEVSLKNIYAKKNNDDDFNFGGSSSLWNEKSSKEPSGKKALVAETRGGIHWFQGIREDITARLPLYLDDWDITNSNALKIVSATFFAYFTSIMPAIIFGDQLDGTTDGTYGIPEVIAATGIMGILYSIFAGQGLVIIGVTGPVVFFVNTVVGLADAIDAPFLQFMSWICLWCGLMHVIVAASGATVLVQRVTNFSGEIFGFFISLAYIYLGLIGLLELFWQRSKSDDDDYDDNGKGPRSPTGRRGAAFASLCLAYIMYKLAISFHHAQLWRILQDSVRNIIMQFGMVSAICFCTLLSYTPVFRDAHADLERLSCEGSFGGSSVFIPLFGGDMQSWQIIFAIMPAFMLLVLFFFDHNVSSLLSQSPRFNLEKPPSYHYDYAVLGLILMICGIIGVPPGNGLIPQAPLHVRALATIQNVVVDENGDEMQEEDASGTSASQRKVEVYRKVEEKRWSNLLQSALCLASFAFFPVLSMMPRAVLCGTFLYMGVSGFDGNDLFERVCCLFMEPSRRPDFSWARSSNIAWESVEKYTMIQLTCVIVVFFVSFNCFLGLHGPPIAVSFPLFIAALVPLRERILTKVFTAKELSILDPVADADEELDNDNSRESAYQRASVSVQLRSTVGYRISQATTTLANIRESDGDL